MEKPLYVVTVELETEADQDKLLDLLDKWEMGVSGVEEPKGGFNVTTLIPTTEEEREDEERRELIDEQNLKYGGEPPMERED